MAKVLFPHATAVGGDRCDVVLWPCELATAFLSQQFLCEPKRIGNEGTALVGPLLTPLPVPLSLPRGG